jgi:hypothetical protein
MERRRWDLPILNGAKVTCPWLFAPVGCKLFLLEATMGSTYPERSEGHLPLAVHARRLQALPARGDDGICYSAPLGSAARPLGRALGHAFPSSDGSRSGSFPARRRRQCELPAQAAGLSAAFAPTQNVVTSGIAEIAERPTPIG